MDPIDEHKIEDYLLGKMSSKTLEEFEARLKTDVSLAKEVETQKILLSYLEELGDIQTRNRIRKIHQSELNQQSSRPKYRNLFRWAAAATILILVISYWLLSTETTPQTLYANHYAPYALTFGSRTGTDENDLQKASQMYAVGKYQEAGTIFEKEILDNPENSKARLAYSISKMELGAFDAALEQFDYLIQNNDPLYAEQALWYSALSHLHTGEIAQSKEKLNRILTIQNAQFQEQASELLSQLEKLPK